MIVSPQRCEQIESKVESLQLRQVAEEAEIELRPRKLLPIEPNVINEVRYDACLFLGPTKTLDGREADVVTYKDNPLYPIHVEIPGPWRLELCPMESDEYRLVCLAFWEYHTLFARHHSATITSAQRTIASLLASS